jgi:uncharacterized protein
MKRSLEQELVKWKEKEQRCPLLLRGARQVGKTYLIDYFGKKYFDSYVSLNFEAQIGAIACFESLDVESILFSLQTFLKEKIIPGKTLLFLDEIQNCPKAILALRYFKEKLPSLHVIGAGSLLEFAIQEGKFSFPVGRVQFMYLKPFSFIEFLCAQNKEFLIDEALDLALKNKFSQENHDELIKLIRLYFLIGGMPSVILNYCQNYSLDEINENQELLLSTYKADFSKYAKDSSQKYLKIVFPGIFPLISHNFKYSNIDPDLRSREIKYVLEHLINAGLIYQIFATSANGYPLAAGIKHKKFKIIFLDIGLAQHALKIDPKIILEKNIIQVNNGAIAEQFVGQELLAYSKPIIDAQLFYWEREKSTSSSEIDYVYSFDHQIIPIEVKAGATGRLKSLRIFMNEKKSKIGVRILQKPFSCEKDILTVPFYLISKLAKIIEHFC